MGQQWQWEQGELGAVRNGVSGGAVRQACLPSAYIASCSHGLPWLCCRPHSHPDIYLAPGITATALPLQPLPPTHLPCFCIHCHLQPAPILPLLPPPTAIRRPTWPLHTSLAVAQLAMYARARAPRSRPNWTMERRPRLVGRHRQGRTGEPRTHPSCNHCHSNTYLASAYIASCSQGPAAAPTGP